MKTLRLKTSIGLILAGAALVSCSRSGSSSGESAAKSTPLASYAPKSQNFRVSLTDAPKKGVKAVLVNVDSIELWLRKENKEARLIVGRDLGIVDLLKLQNGVLAHVSDFMLSPGITIFKIRVVLKGSGNSAIKSDNSVCELKTPSAQQSGIKIELKTPVTIESGYSYSLVIDFDAEKSIVMQGNGGCLLKPVIKVAGFTRKPIDQVDNGGTDPGEDVTDGEENDNSGDSGGGTGTSPSPGPTPAPTPVPTPTPTPDPGPWELGDPPEEYPGFDPDNSLTWPPGWEPSTVNAFFAS